MSPYAIAFGQASETIVGRTVILLLHSEATLGLASVMGEPSAPSITIPIILCSYSYNRLPGFTALSLRHCESVGNTGILVISIFIEIVQTSEITLLRLSRNNIIETVSHRCDQP